MYTFPPPLYLSLAVCRSVSLSRNINFYEVAQLITKNLSLSLALSLSLSLSLSVSLALVLSLSHYHIIQLQPHNNALNLRQNYFIIKSKMENGAIQVYQDFLPSLCIITHEYTYLYVCAGVRMPSTCAFYMNTQVEANTGAVQVCSICATQLCSVTA